MGSIYDNEAYAVTRPRKGLRFERPTHKDVTADATLTYSDPEMIHLDATAGIMTVTLPAVPFEGLCFHMSEVAGLGTAVTIDAGLGNTINGVRMLTMNAAFRQRTLRAISTTAWIIVKGIL